MDSIGENVEEDPDMFLATWSVKFRWMMKELPGSYSRLVLLTIMIMMVVLMNCVQDDQRMRGGRGGWWGGDRWGDIYAGASTKKMIALYDYDPMELSPNVDMEVGVSLLY